MLSCGPKKAVIYCIVAALIIFTKECVNTIMNINILEAEKRGGPAPLGPIAGSATEHYISVRVGNSEVVGEITLAHQQ